MLKKNFGFLFPIFILFCLSLNVSGQSKTTTKSLLWKISGNNLQQPSYLYGTIHLTDKRVFNFGDSLYSAIEKVNGFAMEMHPDSVTNEYLYSSLSADTTALLKTLMSKKDFNRLSPEITSRTGKPAALVTVRNLIEAPEDWSKDMFKEGNMSNFMDAWLCGVAKKQGKWIGGIEDVADQSTYINPPVNNAQDVENLLKSKTINQKYIDDFVKIYLQEDIQKISEADGSKIDDDTVLIRRNIKMTYRIDSLAAIRSTFFAVGAAHLPGEQGLIELLQKKGYQLSPVLSSSRLHASKYQYKEVATDWVTVVDNDSLFTVEMPGNPDQKIEGLSTTNMKMYADMTLGVAYLSAVILAPVDVEKSDTLLTTLVSQVMAKGHYSKPVDVEFSGMKGKEIMGKSDDAHLRFRVFFRDRFVYFLVLSGTQEELLHDANAERFLHSIKLLSPKPPVEWSTFAPAGEYVSVKMPGQVTNVKLPNQSGLSESQSINVYTAVDNKTGNTYMIRSVKSLGDYYLPNDSIYFKQLRELFIQNTHSPVVMDSSETVVEGYPAYTVLLKSGDNFAFRFVLINRGNRMYALAMISDWDKRFSNDAQSFFSSVKFNDYPSVPLKKKTGWNNAFSADLQGSFIDKKQTEDFKVQGQDDTRYTYAYDSAAAITYYVMRDSVNRFSWKKSDTDYYNVLRKVYTKGYDSAGAFKVVKNGALTGIEMDVYSKVSHQIKRVRIVFDMYATYEIFAYLTPELARKPYYNRFFETFRVANEKAAISMYQNKGCALLQALKSQDSILYNDAKAALTMVSFDSTNLACLYDAMLTEYKFDSTNYLNINEEIFDILSGVADNSVVKHIESIYPSLPITQHKFSQDLLNILASYKTDYSYQVLKKLLKVRLPETAEREDVFYSLGDSLALTKTLFPDILRYASDTNMVMGLAYLSNSLLDSALIDIGTVKSYHLFWEAAAAKKLKEYKLKDTEIYFSLVNDLLQLLGKLNTVEGNRLLQQYAGLKNQGAAYLAVKTLIHSKQPVQAAHLLALCAENNYRKYIYDELKEAGRLKLFPAKYNNQKYFAESAIFEMASEDYTPKLKYLGERQLKFEGKTQKFYLFKISFDAGEEGQEIEEYLGIAGPFDLNPSKVEMKTDASCIYYDEKFDAKKIDKQVNALMKQMKADYEQKK